MYHKKNKKCSKNLEIPPPPDVSCKELTGIPKTENRVGKSSKTNFMRKIIMLLFCGILLHNNTFSKPNSLAFINSSEELVERLAADKDFQEFSVFSIHLFAKLKSTNLIDLFKEVKKMGSLEKVATKEYLLKTGFNSVQEIRNSFSKLGSYLQNIRTKFPELIDGPNKEIILIKALEILKESKFYGETITTKAVFPVEWCWSLYVICSMNCFIEYSCCFELLAACESACSSGMGLCSLFAD